MSESPFILDANAENFQTSVIDNSFNQPVLVDFWADWCNPCQMLMPILAKLANDYQGKFILVKINSDQNQDLAVQHGVRSLPTIKLFKDGQVVDEFMGALPESDIRTFLDKHISSATDNEISKAMQAYDEGREQDAMDILNQALANDPGNASLKISIVKLLAEQGDNGSALTLLESLSPEDKNNEQARELLAKINMNNQLEGLPDKAELEKILEENPDNLLAMLQLSHHLSASADYAGAMELLLSIMQKDRGFENEVGKTNLLALFDMLGNEHADVKTYRRKMFTLLH